MKTLRPNSINFRWALITVIALALIWSLSGIRQTSTAQTTPARIAVVDVTKTLTTSWAGKTAYDKLKKLQDDRVAKGAQMQAELKTLTDTINTQRASLTAARLAELTTQRDAKQAEVQRFAKDADKEISEARDRELAVLDTKVKPIIDAMGKEMGLAAIFNKFESGLVYASDAIDITDTVIQRLNQAYPQKPGE